MVSGGQLLGFALAQPIGQAPDGRGGSGGR